MAGARFQTGDGIFENPPREAGCSPRLAAECGGPRSAEREHVSCPLCERDAPREAFTSRDLMYDDATPFRWVVCTGCGLYYLNPRPPAAVIGQFYPDTYYSYQAPPDGSSAGGTVAGHTWGGNRTPQVVVKEVLQRSGGAVLYRGLKAVKTAALRLSPGIPEWVRKGLPPPDLAPGRILDVGCGAGHFLDVARARGWETWGADLSVSAVRSAAARGHRVRAGDVRQADFPAGSFDAVRLWQTLEHVHDPVSVLRTCRELLQPGGTLLLGVPNVAGRPARWFGPAWMGWDVPRHMWAFAPDTLTRLVRKCGLDTSDHRVYATPLLLGLSDHWKQGKTLETLDQSGRWTRLKWYWAAGILDRTGEGDLICLTARKKGAGSA